MSQTMAVRAGLADAVKTLPPGYFALVMATGIVAIACHQQQIPLVPQLLGAFNWAAYATLVLLTLARVVLYPGAVLNDLSDHVRSPGFLTMVAATSVIGAQTMAFEHGGALGSWLWYAAVALWLLIMYSFLVSMAVAIQQPALERALSGGWLLLVVATQSIAVLGAAVGAHVTPPAPVQLLCLAFFLLGMLLYIVVITLIFYRTLFMPMSPEEFGPLYWIDTGGAAISTLAGSALLLRAQTWPLLARYVPFLEGATLLVWAAATFWLPFLIAMTVWRYGVRRDRFRYAPGLWGMVFPLGMYSAATFELARAQQLAFLHPLVLGFAIVALGAWLLVAGAFVAAKVGLPTLGASGQ
jgi:tellurite resistance protein TehA-like permease